MPYAISPYHTDQDFPNGLSLDDKIVLFEARVEGWQLGLAHELIRRDVPHRGFAILYIVFSLFEMVGKYRDGYINEDRSREYFRKGLQYFYPDMPEAEVEKLSKDLYKKVRNALYHLGMIRPLVFLSHEVPGSLGYHEDIGAIAINPDQLVVHLMIRFQDYIAELKNPINEVLRMNFEKRFDIDNGESQL